MDLNAGRPAAEPVDLFRVLVLLVTGSHQTVVELIWELWWGT